MCRKFILCGMIAGCAVLIGCGPRSVVSGHLDDSREASVRLPSGTSTVETGAGFRPFNSLIWVNGTSTDFVDVFTAKPDSADRLESFFVRITRDNRGPRLAIDEVYGHDLVEAYRSAPKNRRIPNRSEFNFVRWYDIGQCSLVLGWREIFEDILDGIPAIVAEAETMGRPRGLASIRVRDSITLSPIFSTRGRDGRPRPDAVRLVVPLLIDADAGDVRTNLVIVINLHPVGNPGLQPVVRSVNFERVRVDALATILGSLGTLFGEPSIRTRLNRSALMIRASVRTELNRIIPAEAAIALRSHVRPEGLEAVLVEDGDRVPEVIRAAGLCNRRTTAPIVGYVGAFFEDSRRRPDPPLFSVPRSPN